MRRRLLGALLLGAASFLAGAVLGSQALMIGNPGALAYDSGREQILAPN